ncbi:MAG: hypothetical protein A4E57_02652 [Syntrophorhabdaceae bacterium PtaU1.Bin034]|nr:MAG: hypothetical protein A4E57_02652 [Syntrophorhabdaceae bacterium PtaU1.Bin034]
MKGRKRFKIIAGLIVLLVGGAGTGVTLYTDLLFFHDVGYTGVFLKMLSARFLSGLAFGLAALLFILGNVMVANRRVFPHISMDLPGRITIPIPVEHLDRTVKVLGIAGAFAIAVIAGIWGSSMWRDVLVFANSVTAGTADPILGRDVGFYLFQLPLIRILKGFSAFVLVITLLMVASGYFFRGAVVPLGRSLAIDARARKHVSFLGGLFILSVAAGFYLDRFALLFSPGKILFGAGYTDVNARLFVLDVLVVLAAVTAVLFTVGLWRGKLKLALVPIALTIIVYIGGLLAYPALLQSLKVTPNEINLEVPFIQHHINFTRFAYDLDRIEMRPFDPGYTLTSGDIQKNDATIKNIRLWDHAPLLRTYSQLQQIRTYYRFTDIDNDRYTVNGTYRQVMLSPRELSYTDLPSRSWINEKMIFTHGNGVALGPVNRISREGLPEFFIKDIPPVSDSDIKVTRPEIYFGELSSDYVIVKTKMKEFSYPTSEGNVYASYEGTKGPRLDSLIRKAAFASRFSSAKILLSSDITKESRILYNREVRSRVQTIAPFLVYDKDPYIVVADDGRLHWILDAYTISGGVPYSKPMNRNINYIRNSVKATVDAYDGTVNFYISDPRDVVARVYDRMFPGLLKPLDAMPEDLKRHIRYPQELFHVQASMFAVYHMTDPRTFYNKEDLWEIPAQGDKVMEPYYTIMKLPQDAKGAKGGAAAGGKEEYILLLPFTPAKRDNLAAWLAARCDGQDYGKMVVYSFPRDRLVFGPRQVSARIDQDSQISQQLTLWGQKGAKVIRGRLLVIPIERSLLYVQPLYLVASDEGGLPELRRVIVAYENDVVMEENLEAGLLKLFGQRTAVPAKGEQATAVKEDLGVGQLAKEAMKIFEKASEAQRQGDWAGYGEHLKRLEETLKKLAR